MQLTCIRSVYTRRQFSPPTVPLHASKLWPGSALIWLTSILERWQFLFNYFQIFSLWQAREVRFQNPLATLNHARDQKRIIGMVKIVRRSNEIKLMITPINLQSIAIILFSAHANFTSMKILDQYSKDINS